MAFGRDKNARANLRAAGVAQERGSLRQAGAYLLSSGAPANFVVSGGDETSRAEVMICLLGEVMGRFPVIVMHNGNSLLEAAAIDCWKGLGLDPQASPLFVANQSTCCLEPFYGMPERQALTVLRGLARELGYTVTPRFERVSRAHLSILRELDLPLCLTALSYLTSFQDMGEFHDNVLALPCGVAAAQRIWSDLGVDDQDANSQFDLFRSVVDNLAFDAERSAWSSDGSIAEVNCLTSLSCNATLLLSVNNEYSQLLLSYLAMELQACGSPYLLVLDGLTVGSETCMEFLLRPSPNRVLGVSSENAVDFLAGDVESFQRLAERARCLLLFKHGVGSTATTLSELIGRFDSMEVDTTSGTNRGFFSLLPDGSHKDVHTRLENRFRVMPEDIISLGPSQAIVFDVGRNEVIYYN